MKEGHPQLPISPYGTSKLVVEQILRDSMLTRAFARSSFDISMRPEPTSKDESENDTIRK